MEANNELLRNWQSSRWKCGFVVKRKKEERSYQGGRTEGLVLPIACVINYRCQPGWSAVKVSQRSSDASVITHPTTAADEQPGE